MIRSPKTSALRQAWSTDRTIGLIRASWTNTDAGESISVSNSGHRLSDRAAQIPTSSAIRSSDPKFCSASTNSSGLSKPIPMHQLDPPFAIIMKKPNPVSKRLSSASPPPTSSVADSKAPKKSPPSSHSNGLREDQEMRQMKTSHKPQNFPHRP